HDTFSIKPGDDLGKCFHPACGRVLTPARSGPFLHSISTILERIAIECHQELLRLATLGPQQQNAYTYLRDERSVHPQVIEEAMPGAVPPQYDVRPYFQDAIKEVQTALNTLQGPGRGRLAKKELAQKEQLEIRLQKIQEDQGKLGHLLEKYARWLV